MEFRGEEEEKNYGQLELPQHQGLQLHLLSVVAWQVNVHGSGPQGQEQEQEQGQGQEREQGQGPVQGSLVGQ